MKKIITLFVFFISTIFYAQTTGISYQAVIYNPAPEVLPGHSQTNFPLVNKNVCLKFSIIDATSTVEYQETIKTTTDEFGMVNLVIGTGTPIGGYAPLFEDIVWDSSTKKLQVELDVSGSCTTFLEISNQSFTAVPFAFASKTAENVTGVVAIVNGGTGASTVAGAKINLGLNNVDNTSDINKPISTATQAALNDKAPLASPSLTGIPLSPTAPPGTNTNQIATTAFVTTAIAAATIPDATTTAKGKIKLAGDLGGTADLPIIQNAAVTTTKIASGGDNKVLVTDNSGAVAWIDKDAFGVMADQITIEGAGTTTSPFKVKDLGIVTNKIAAAAVTPNKIAPGANNTVLVTDFMGNVAWIDSNAFGAVADMTTIEGLGTTASPFKVKDLGIITSKLANDAVTTPKIANAAVTTTKIASGGNSKVLVTDNTGVVTWLDATAFGAVADMSTIEGAGTTASPFKVKDLGIITAKLADNAVTTVKIADANVTTNKIADGNVTNAKLTDLNVTTNKLANAAVTTTKIASGGNNKVLVTDNTGVVTWLDATAFGAVADMTTIEGAGTSASPFKVKDLGIITAKIADGAVTTEKIADLNVSTNKVANSAITTAKLADAAVTTTKLADASVTTTKIASGGNNKVLVTDNTGVVAWIDGTAFGAVADMSTIEGAGTTASPFKVKDLGIITAKLADNAVTTVKIADANVTTAKIANSNVTTEKIADANVTNAKLATDAVTTEKILDGTIIVGDLANNAVETAKIKDLNVTTTKLADASVTTTKIASGGNNKVLVTDNTGVVAWIDGTAFGAVADMSTIEGAGTTASPFKVKDLGIITAKLADNAVTTIKIADANVTTAKIADSNVTTAKIADSNVTNAKLATDAVTTEKILDGTIIVGDLANNAIETAKIKDLNVTTTKLADASVTTTKIASGGNNKVLVTDNTGVVAWIDGTAFGAVADMSTIEGAGTTASPFKVKDLGIITAKLADNAVTTIKIADANVTTAKIADSNVTTAKIADSNVTNAKLATDAVTTEKILDGTIIVGDLANNAIETAKIKDLNVTTTKLADASVTTTKIASGGNNKVLVTDNTGVVAWIDGTAFGAVADMSTIEGAGTTASPFKVKDLGIITAKLADNAVTTVKIADANVTTAKIADSNITTPKIADANVTTAKIADANVTTAKIADSNVTNIKLATDAVTTDKILNGTIVNEDISDNTITTDKIAGQIAVSEGGTGSDMSTTSGYVKQATVGANFTTVTSIPVADVTGAVRKVNGTLPNSNGEVTINWGTVYSGTLAAIATVVPNPANGDTYVIANDSSTNNGRTFIYDGTSWLEVTPNQAALDARYLRLSGDTMQGNIIIPTNNKITLTDAPTNATDAANKAYVDAQITNATPDASTSVKGKIQLGGDLAGTGSSAAAPVISNSAITTAKLADTAVTTTKLADAAVTTTKIASGGNNKVLVTDNTGVVAWIDGTAFGAVADMSTIEGAGTTASPFKVKDLGIITAKLADNAVTTVKIADANVTTAKIADSNVTTAKIADSNVTNAKLAADAVTTGKILDGTIIVDDLANNAVETAKIKDLNVTTTKLADAAVTTTKIASGGNNKVLVTDNTGVVAWIDGTAFGAVADMSTIEGAGTTASPFKVKDLGIITAKLADNAVTTVKIADANITTAKIADASISTAKVIDGNITTTKLANAAVTTTKIASGGNNKVLVTDNTGVVAWLDATAFGAVSDMSTIEGAGTTASPFKLKDLGIITAKLADNAVTTIKIADANVTTAKIADSNVTTAKIADANVTTVKIADTNVTTAKLADTAVTTTKLADAAVTTTKIASGGNNKVLVTDNSGVVAWIDGTAFGAVADMSTIEGAGTTASPFKVKDLGIITAKLADNAVTTVKIADANVTTAKIADSNVTTAKIADSNVTNAKLAADAVTTGKILDGTIIVDDLANNAVETAKIKDLNVTTTKLADAAVTTTKIASGGNNKVLVTDNTGVVAWIDGTAFGAVADMSTIEGAGTTASPFKVKDLGIITAKLADNAVTTVKIADANVTTAKIADSNVTTAKIADANVTTAKIADLNVTTVKIADANVTTDKLANASVTVAKIASGGNSKVLVTDNTGVVAWIDGTAFGAVADMSTIEGAGTTASPFKVKDLGVITDKLANDAVTTTKIADGTILVADLANDAVETSKIKDLNVTTTKLAIDAVTTAKILNGTILNEDIADNTITTAKIAGQVAVADGGTGSDMSTSIGYVKQATSGANFTTVTSIPVVDVSGAVRKVNGSLPDSSGNVTVDFGTVSTGILANIPLVTTPGLTNGDIYVVSGDSNPLNNGLTYIFDGAQWQEVTPNQAALDARYLKLAGGTMQGDIVIPATKKITLTDAPNTATDAVNKAYVDAQIAGGAIDATTSVKGKIQLGGDLAGTGTTAATPIITDNAITSNKINADAVTSAKIANGTIQAVDLADAIISNAKLAETITVANGGTGTTSLTGYVKGNGTNPMTTVSTLPVADVVGAQTIANLATDITANTGSNTLYPSIAAVETFVANNATPDATTTSKGKIKLAGDLSGTADLPTVPALATKAPIASPSFTGIPLAPTAAAGTNSTQIATTEFVTTAVAAATIPDASTTVKGKIQLAGDLAGSNDSANPTIATGAVSTTKLADNAVTTIKITDANVTTAKIANDAITNAKLADNAVQTENIVDANITTSKLANASVTTSKIVAGSNNTVMVTDATGTVNWIDRSTFGAVADQTTVEGAGTTLNPFKVKDGAITTAKLADNAVITTKINDDAITTSKITANAVTTVKLVDNAVTSAKIVDGNITTVKITNDAITNAKLADNAVQTENIVDANITTSKLANASVTTSKIVAGSNNTVMVTDATGTVNWIDRSTFGAVSDQTTIEGAGTTLNPFAVKDGAITTAKLADNAVTTAKINDDAITTSKITGAAITTVKLADNAVTTTKIADNAVTNAKIGELISVENGGSGSDMTATYGYVKQATAGANFTTVTSIPVADVTGAVKKVNGSSPDSNGNVSVTFGTVYTGTLANRATVVATPNNGDIYVVSNDTNTLINGNTFIYDGTTWQEVTANQASLDARYLKLAGGTMQGDITIPTGKRINLTDAPSNATDAVNKAYVDAQITAVTIPDADATIKGRIQLAGDLGGTATAPLVAKLQGTTVSSTAPTTGQVLQYDGTSWKPVSATTLVKMETDEFTATAGQTSFTVTATPIGKIAMFINGVRVPKTAISVSGTTVTYLPANNGGYTVLVDDRITFDYITN